MAANCVAATTTKILFTTNHVGLAVPNASTNAGITTDGTNLNYYLYTSGATGQKYTSQSDVAQITVDSLGDLLFGAKITSISVIFVYQIDKFILQGGFSYFVAQIDLLGYQTYAIVKFNTLQLGSVVFKASQYFYCRQNSWIPRIETATTTCSIITFGTWAIDEDCLNADQQGDAIEITNDTDTTDITDDESYNRKVILGVSIGLSVLSFLLIIALILVCVHNNKKNSQVKIGPGFATKDRF